MGPGATRIVEGIPRHGGGWNKMIFKVSSNPNPSVTVQFVSHCVRQPQEPRAACAIGSAGLLCENPVHSSSAEHRHPSLHRATAKFPKIPYSFLAQSSLSVSAPWRCSTLCKHLKHHRGRTSSEPCLGGHRTPLASTLLLSRLAGKRGIVAAIQTPPLEFKNQTSK